MKLSYPLNPSTSSASKLIICHTKITISKALSLTNTSLVNPGPNTDILHFEKTLLDEKDFIFCSE